MADTYYNRVLFETANFKVIPTLGSIVEGWLLIIPKKHAISLACLSESNLVELEGLKNKVVMALESRYNTSITVFEHGPVSSKTVVGCGVDYAHLHIVPINANLIEIISSDFEIRYQWYDLKSITELHKIRSHNSPYLYYEQLGQSKVAIDPEIPSQLFRKAIASHIGCLEMFDWKTCPFYENIHATIKALEEIQFA